jgi:hypothetical protein
MACGSVLAVAMIETDGSKGASSGFAARESRSRTWIVLRATV